MQYSHKNSFSFQMNFHAKIMFYSWDYAVYSLFISQRLFNF